MTTTDEIKSNIQAAVPELTSDSSLSIWGKIAQAVGLVIDNTKTEISNSQYVIDNIITNQRYGRSGYYIEKALLFQYDALIPQTLSIDPDTLDPIYDPVDTTKQIIKQAAFAIRNSLGAQYLTLKVAKLDGADLAPLDVTEKAAFDSYFLNFEVPGLPVSKVSQAPDEFNFTLIIQYYSTYDRSQLETEVQAALIDFRDNFEFNGVLYVNDLESFLKTSIPGIRNATLQNPTIKDASTGVTSSINIYTELGAGYFNYAVTVVPSIQYNAVS